ASPSAARGNSTACTALWTHASHPYSHVVDEQHVHVDVSLAQLLQWRVVGVVVPCFGLLDRRELYDDHAEGRPPIPFQRPNGVAPEYLSAVFFYQGIRPRAILRSPRRVPRF